MIRDENFLDDAEVDIDFNVFPTASFVITFHPFPDESDAHFECTLVDLIWEAVSQRIENKENPKTISNYLRMLASEIDGACDDS
jgi:hypothetical protein